MIRQLFLSGILALSIFSCKNDFVEGQKDLQLVTLIPAACGNPWQNKTYGVNLSTEEKITKYLQENGVKQISNFELISDNEVHCLSCGCPSGITISFKVSSKDYKRLKTIPPFSDNLK